jgi:hypothetical protein
MTLGSEVIAELSSRACAWARARPLTRVPEWSLTDAELRKLLEGLELPYSEAMADYERQVGGWRHAADVELQGFGFGIALRRGPGCRSSAIAKELSSWRDVFEGSESDAQGPLIGLGYPHVFFRDVHLVPFGMLGEEYAYFVSATGTIYRYWTLGDTLRAEADRCLSWLESSALEAERMSWCQVHVAADVAGLAVERLGCDEKPVVSDGVQTVWTSAVSHVALINDLAPNVYGTLVACKEPKGFVDTLQKVIDGQPDVVLSGFANGIQGGRGRGVLATIGIEY